VGHFPALAKEVASELAGDVEHSEASLVVSHVQGIAGDPDIVAPPVLWLVVRYFSRVREIADIEHMQAAVGSPQPHHATSLGRTRRCGDTSSPTNTYLPARHAV
jgi:hypothetical protein